MRVLAIAACTVYRYRQPSNDQLQHIPSRYFQHLSKLAARNTIVLKLGYVPCVMCRYNDLLPSLDLGDVGLLDEVGDVGSFDQWLVTEGRSIKKILVLGIGLYNRAKSLKTSSVPCVTKV